MANKSKEELQKEIVLKMVQAKLITPAQQEQARQSILAETAPALIEADRAAGLDDDDIIAKHIDAWLQAKGNSAASEEKKAPAHGKVSAPASVNLTAEERQQLDMIINQDAVAKGQKTAQSKVLAVLTDKPVMSQIFVSGSMLTPVLPEEMESKLSKWESELVDTPENKQAFAQATAAWTKKEPMKVFINEKARPKVIGFKINTLGENGTPETKVLTKEDAVIFLACEVNGIIPARDDQSIGIKLRWRASRKATDTTSNSSAGSSVVAVINQKLIKDNKSLEECTSTVVDSEINEKYRAKSEMCFQLVGTRKKNDGTPINRTMRLSGVTKVKAVKRLEQYVPMFGPVGGRKSGGQSAKSLQAQQEAVRLTIKSLSTGGMTLSSDYARQTQANIQRQVQAVGNPAAAKSFV